MPRIEPFEAHAARYDAWFERHQAAYVSELLTLRPFVPLSGRGLEIGVGGERSAAPLGVQAGIAPSASMLARAHARGVEVVEGTAEHLPFADDSFDHALVVTTLCFVDSPAAMLAEARRVLKPGGTLVIGFSDRESPIGRDYDLHREASVFYRDARFHSAAEVERLGSTGAFRYGRGRRRWPGRSPRPWTSSRRALVGVKAPSWSSLRSAKSLCPEPGWAGAREGRC